MQDTTEGQVLESLALHYMLMGADDAPSSTAPLVPVTDAPRIDDYGFNGVSAGPNAPTTGQGRFTGAATSVLGPAIVTTFDRALFGGWGSFVVQAGIGGLASTFVAYAGDGNPDEPGVAKPLIEQRLHGTGKRLAQIIAEAKNGRLFGEDLTKVQLSDTEILAILETAKKTGRRIVIWAADNLSDDLKKDADKDYPDLPAAERYARKAQEANYHNAKYILIIRNTNLGYWVGASYELLRSLNPVHFALEKGYAVGSGKELVLPGEADRGRAAFDLILYIGIIKGTDFAMAKFKGAALGTGAGAAADGPLNLFKFKNGGELEIAPGARYSPEQIEDAIDLANAGYKVKLGLPKGLTDAQFNEAAVLIRANTGQIGGRVVVQGSRAAGTATPASDIDFAIRVSPKEFDALIKARFGNPNPGSAKFKTMQHAIDSGKITARWAGLSKLRDALQKLLGIDVHISIIRAGGEFDNAPFIPIP